MYCPNCGTENKVSAKYCTSCGSAILPKDKETPKEVKIDQNLKGLGGWLIFVILGLFAVILLQGYGAYESIIMLTDGSIDSLSNPASDLYVPQYKTVLYLEFIFELIFVGAAIYLIDIFFKKSKRFPVYYVPFLIASIIVVILEYIFLVSLSVPSELKSLVDDLLAEQSTTIFQTAISSLIWISYIRKSKRVKATFVER